MQVTTKISVDMARPNLGVRVNAVQGDCNTRFAKLVLLARGSAWSPPDGVEAAIAYCQPDGHKGLYNKLADGTDAISISGNVVTIILAPQMLTVSGTVQAALVFNDAQLNRLTTFPFSVSVASNPASGAQKTEDYLRLKWLEDKLDEYVDGLNGTIGELVEEYLKDHPPAGGGYLVTDNTLTIKDGVLGVNTADVVEKDNTLPVTSAAVQVVVGNISAILDTI